MATNKCLLAASLIVTAVGLDVKLFGPRLDAMGLNSASVLVTVPPSTARLGIQRGTNDPVSISP